jgi:rhodanese-related sulfurtransferase
MNRTQGLHTYFLPVSVLLVCFNACLLIGCTPQPVTTTATITTTSIMTSPPTTVTTTATTTLPAQTVTAIVTTTTTVTPTSPTQIIQTLTPAESYTLIQTNLGNPKFVIIDLRTPTELAAAGKIANSILMDYNAGIFDSQVGGLNHNMKYLIYCKSGVRSAKALATMKALYFAEVYEEAGGMNAWIAAGLPVINGP